MSSEPRIMPAPDAAIFEPSTMLDFAEPPEIYGVDSCLVLYQEPALGVRIVGGDRGRPRRGARAQLAGSADGARLVLRLICRRDGDQELHDVDLMWHHGRRYLPAPRPGAEIRLAVGLVSTEGYLRPHRAVAAAPAPGGRARARRSCRRGVDVASIRRIAGEWSPIPANVDYTANLQFFA